MLTWVAIVFIFGGFALLYALFNRVYLFSIVVSFLLGVFQLQNIFGFTHARGHSQFLEPEIHKPGNKRLIDLPIYFRARTHHFKDKSWVKFMSYDTDSEENGYAGTRDIATAHWHGYTMIGSWQLIYVILWMIVCPLNGVWAFGHEIGTLLLPAFHGWEHKFHKKMGILNPLFIFMEGIRLLAGPLDHLKHHVHTWPTVFQNFFSSGIYSKRLDELVDKWWNMSCYHAMNIGVKPYDVIRRPVDVIIWVCKVGIPIFIYLVL